jgi:hypothetical protein
MAWGAARYWNITGYAHAIAGGERPSYQPGIEVLNTIPRGDKLEIQHLGDISEGNLGSPFWATWPDGFPDLIGTCSGRRNISGEVNANINGGANGHARPF